MALTKAQLKEILSAAGCPTENIEGAVAKIMEGHITSVNALREERDAYKADAEKLPDVQKELDNLKAKGDPDWQKKYEDEHNSFETYKTQISGERERAQKTRLYRKLLRECKVEEKRIDAVLKVTDIDSLSIEDGGLKDADNLKADIEKEWAGFIVVEKPQGANVEKPPANEGGGKKFESRAAKLAAEYHKSLYGESKGD